MNFFKASRAVIAAILGPCYSKRFVFEDAYQDDDIFDAEQYDYCFYNCDDDLVSILSDDI
jgi:hypothetical protein